MFLDPLLILGIGRGELFSRKAEDVIGLAVIHVHTGEKIGHVLDLYFDDAGVLCGLQLDSSGIWRKGPFLMSEDILAIGEDAVTVATDIDRSAVDISAFHSLREGRDKLKGKPVITKNGMELGWVEDVYFHAELGTIIGYELTDGFLSDITAGRKMLPRLASYTIGTDAIVVPNEMEEKLTDRLDG